jgi:AcrR family transcriptional regulator
MTSAETGTGTATKSGSRRVSRARAERYREREQLILDTAFKLLQPGPGQTISVTEILNETGLSTRAFYRQFESRDELILQMCRTEFAKMTIRLARAVGGAATPRKALEAWIDEALSVAYDQRRARRAMILSSPDAHAAEGFRVIAAEGLAAQRQLLAEVIAAGKAKGDFPLAEPDDDARAIQAIVNDLTAARLNGEPGPPRDRARRHLVEVFTRAFGSANFSPRRRP